MSKGLVYIIVMLVILCCQSVGVSEEGAVPSVTEGVVSGVDEQIEINKNAMLSGQSEEIRLSAAGLLLAEPNPSARKVLIDILGSPENSEGRLAICKALIQSHIAQKAINTKEQFIEPLISVLKTGKAGDAKLAAEAMLIFEYDQVASKLAGLAKDATLGVSSRLNVIYALQLQPDIKAVFTLIDLLDDPDVAVQGASEKALQSLGIMDSGLLSRQEIIKELTNKGPDEFLRDLLLQKDRLLRERENESKKWLKMYLVTLDDLYAGKKTEERGKFLANYLSSTDKEVKLWALTKVEEWQVGTGDKLNLATEVGPVLLAQLGDADSEVRFGAARLISLMGKLNSAEKLLEQLEKEQNEEVRVELFTALGGACYYAFLPDAEFKVPVEIKKKTLDLAIQYLQQPDCKIAKEGADVIRKLLEQDGLTAENVGFYLNSLVRRYERADTNEILKGDLLNAMAILCGQSVYKTESAGRFKGIFDKAIGEENTNIREAAVEGLIYVNDVEALKRFRTEGLFNDRSDKVRDRVIKLAAKIGGKNDMEWLSAKTGNGSESESARGAMLEIFKRSELPLLEEWAARIGSEGNEMQFSEDKKLSFYETMIAKASVSDNAALVNSLKKSVAHIYKNGGKYEEAAKYYGQLYSTATAATEKEAYFGQLLEVYLLWPNVESVVQLVKNRLQEGDLEPNSTVVRLIEGCFSEGAVADTTRKAVMEGLQGIKIEGPRPEWEKILAKWTAQTVVENKAGAPQAGG